MKKMLLILPLVMPSMAFAAPADAPTAQTSPAASTDFLQAAKTVTASIQEKFYKPQTGLYLHRLSKTDTEFMWGNGIMFSALVAGARHEPKVCRPLMSQFFDSMNRYWDTKVKIPGYEPAPTKGGGNDKYYDDNAWMVITFLEAYEMTGDKKYLTRANETLDFVLSGWDEQLGGGIYWHEVKKSGKNTCSNAPTAVACLRMARFGDREENIDWAKRIVEWTHANLQDTDGLFFDSKKIPSGQIDKGKLTYNTALMLRANLGLYAITGEQKYLDEAKRIGDASDWFLSDQTGAYRDPPKWSHLQIEADLELYRFTGDEKALARARRNGEHMWQEWQKNPQDELIEQASVARTLWLLADHDTEVGRKFWERADRWPGARQSRQDH